MMLASLSLDLDNQWSYMKAHGDEGWRALPTYLPTVVPHALGTLARLDLRITFFVVGQDAAQGCNRAALRAIPQAGHEIACHSFHHEPWMQRYSDEQVLQEFERAEASIESATGRHPRGFRGPGFSFSRRVLETLAERSYLYDASTFPTYIGPLARAYYLLFADLDEAQREERKQLFGDWRDGLRPVAPYQWELGSHALLEIPVTTMPFLRVPFHVSYVLYLSCFSPTLARAYFRTALALCRSAGVEPSVLLHPLDLLGGDEIDGLDFFPAMQLSGAVKRERVAHYLSDLKRSFRVVSMEEHARALLERGGLARRSPPSS
jgi:peptidoglycan/xylan/chitin deacetylase (PgdA/CDA1 family)